MSPSSQSTARLETHDVHCDELDQVISKIQQIIDKHKRAHQQRKLDWLPVGPIQTGLRRCRRGSASWVRGTWVMQMNGAWFWHQGFTGRRRNINTGRNDEPNWHFETFQERIREEAFVVFYRHDLISPKSNESQQWQYFLEQIVASLIDESCA